MRLSAILALAFTTLVSGQSCAAIASYNVTKGDTLTAIGAANGVDVTQLLAANPAITNADLIEIGQIISIPASTCVPSSASAGCAGVSAYSVLAGNTLANIATAKGVTLAQLIATNPQIINPDLIQVGQVIAIPSSSYVPATETRRLAARNSPTPPVSCLTSGPTTYTVVGSDGFYTIAVQKLGLIYQSLLDANPQITNPNAIKVGDVLNVPQCPAPPFNNSTSTLNITCVPSAIATYIVRSGDTLYKIAQANNVTLTAVLAVNSQIPTPNSIEIGDIINLPSCSIPEPEIPEATTFTCAVSGNATYTAVAGDSLSAIASRIPITLSALETANAQIQDFDLIFINQTINIPLCPTCIANGTSSHTVVSGDSLSAIASNFSVSLAGLLAQNPAVTNPDLIYPGQVLSIPICGSTPPAPVTCSSSSNGTYVVKSGDTFSAIALGVGITVDALTKANPQVSNIDAIEVGQVLSVPICGTQASATISATVSATGSMKTVFVTGCPTAGGVVRRKEQRGVEKGRGYKRAFNA